MNTPCPKHVLCPEGTGSESAGVNYSSEHIDVPEFFGRYYPPSPYGYYTACQGRCVSLVSQQDADLCAQRLGVLCLNNLGVGPGNPNNSKPPNQIFCNQQQVCNSPNTGRLVVVPAGLICADSQAQADAEALSFANVLQKDPATPPGSTVLPGPGPSAPGLPVNAIPKPTPPPQKPPVPPMSQCKPCDDTGAVSSFSVVCNVPANVKTIYFESPTLKCGKWEFAVVTNNPGSGDASYVVAYLAAANPPRTMVDPSTLTNCPQMAWVNPCRAGALCDGDSSPGWGIFPGCCGLTAFDCSYAQCQQLSDGNWMTVLRFFHVNFFDPPPDGPGSSSKKFTMNGTWLGPVPPP